MTNKIKPFKQIHSFTDTKGKWFVACCECQRGGNGNDPDKCSSGGSYKKWNYCGCFLGTEITQEGNQNG